MGEDPPRTKMDASDALGTARFAAQNRPKKTPRPELATKKRKELVRLRDRLVQESGGKVRQLHRLLDPGFPGFTRIVKTLDSELAVSILARHPTSAAYKGVPPGVLAKIVHDGRHSVGLSARGRCSPQPRHRSELATAASTRSRVRSCALTSRRSD
jgi:hypothetical protein